MITIKDVARMANVSISTVSRVINNSKPVSEDIRKRVQEVIDETGYKPNDVARSLVTRKSNLIGVIVNDLSDSYVAETVKGVEEVGKMYNYDILLCSTYYVKEEQIKYLKLLNSKQIEGIIMIGYKFDPEVTNYALKYNKNAIFFTNDIADSKIDYVKIDNTSAAYEMTKYLVKKGHKKVAFLAEYSENTSSEKEKEKGYMKALEDNQVSESRIFYAEGKNYESGYNAAEQIIEMKNEISAVFCSNDFLALGVINHCRDKGISVPEDLSVVGYGDYKESKIIRPQLTTVSEPHYDIGAVSIRTLIKNIEGGKVNAKIELPFNLIKRESVRELK